MKKELEILKNLELEGVAGSGDSLNYIIDMIIEVLCENKNINKDIFINDYNKLIKNPLKNYKWTYDMNLDYKNRFDLVELGFYKLNDLYKE